MSGAPAPSSTDTTPALGNPRVHLRRTGSTNELARRLARDGAPHGTLVTASEQTAGRGRQGRRWAAPAGSSLLMTVLLRWPTSDQPPPLLSLIAGVAVCEAVGTVKGTGEHARIKWPNDIVLDGADGRLRKLAGILVEGRPQEGWAVLGIGVNVAVELQLMPADLRGRAATLGRDPDAIEPLLAAVLDALTRLLAREPAEALHAWRARDALDGRTIAWGTASETRAASTHAPGQAGEHAPDSPRRRGVAKGIDDDGHLIVALADGSLETLQAGEVHLEPVESGEAVGPSVPGESGEAVGPSESGEPGDGAAPDRR